MPTSKQKQNTEEESRMDTTDYRSFRPWLDDFFRFPILSDWRDRFFNQYTPADIWEDENNVYVKVAAPGMKNEDLNITIDRDSLRVYGQTVSEEKQEDKEKNKRYYMRRMSSSIDERFTLPSPVNADKAEAKYEDGVLNITLPKTEESKPKQIKVK